MATFSFYQDLEMTDTIGLRNAIAQLLKKPEWDDGSLGPVFVRLAWHASGTFDVKSQASFSKENARQEEVTVQQCDLNQNRQM